MVLVTKLMKAPAILLLAAAMVSSTAFVGCGDAVDDGGSAAETATTETDGEEGGSGEAGSGGDAGDGSESNEE